jgi:hypothetical protein
VASSFTPKHVSSPQLLERISQPVLLRLLQKYENYFRSENVMPSAGGKVDYDRLSLVIASPNEVMPAHLMADLFYWDEVAEMAGTDDLVELAEEHGIDIEEEATTEEIALLVRLDAPDALEDLHAAYHAHGLLRKKKRFLSYFVTVEFLPKWKKPTAKRLKSFERDMDNWYDSHKKGRGTRVSLIEKDGAAWFIIRHGETFKRESALDKGQPTLVFYRPEAYDLLIYYHEQGELAIYNSGNGVQERRAYCTYLGKGLYDNPSFFECTDAKKYTLEPLRERGRASLDCTDVEGLQSARLTYLRYRYSGDNNHTVTHRANDVFTGLENIDEEIPEGAELVCMEVKLTPSNELGGERSVRLYAPNISVYDHERDAELAHRFLVEKGFIIPRQVQGDDAA